MEMLKSTRHAKITGDFGEALVLYWLSKHGLECARVDHTGIDLIADNPATHERMGISVKSRSRSPSTGRTSVSIPVGNIDKARTACDAFGCLPYFAVVVDADDLIRAFLLSADRLLALFPPGRSVCSWSMRPDAVSRCLEDPTIVSFELRVQTQNWW
jgi:hypothetical protein